MFSHIAMIQMYIYIELWMSIFMVLFLSWLIVVQCQLSGISAMLWRGQVVDMLY